MLKICSIDITNAYFHGMILDRLMLLRPPRGGLPDKSIPGDSMMLARVPIYGTRDAGRRFWAKLKKVLTDIGLHQNSQCRALFTYQEDGDIKVMIAYHVDDLLYATKPGYESYVQKILEAFHVEKEKISEKNFRFCGREVAQDDQMNIKVTCAATAENIEPVKFRTGLKKTDNGNDAENAQLRSVVGSLAWVARQTRPDLSYRVSRLQSVCGRATIRDLFYCNEVVKDAQEFSKHGLYFEAGAIDWNDCILCTVSDASWSNEKWSSERQNGALQIAKSANDIACGQGIHQRRRNQVLSNWMVFDNHQTCVQINTASRVICHDIKCRRRIQNPCDDCRLLQSIGPTQLGGVQSQIHEALVVNRLQISSRALVFINFDQDIRQEIINRSCSTSTADLGKGWWGNRRDHGRTSGSNPMDRHKHYACWCTPQRTWMPTT